MFLHMSQKVAGKMKRDLKHTLAVKKAEVQCLSFPNTTGFT